MRKTFTSVLAVMFTAMILSFMTMNETAAQSPNCCTYTVIVQGVPPSCFPFYIHSFWGSGFPVVGPFTADGTTIHPTPGPCPPSSPFFGASVNGLFPITPLNSSGQYAVNATCCLRLKIGLDINGCVLIYVLPC